MFAVVKADFSFIAYLHVSTKCIARRPGQVKLGLGQVKLQPNYIGLGQEGVIQGVWQVNIAIAIGQVKGGDYLPRDRRF